MTAETTPIRPGPTRLFGPGEPLFLGPEDECLRLAHERAARKGRTGSLVDLLSYARSLGVMLPAMLGVTAAAGTISPFLTLIDPTGRLAHRLAQMWASALLRVAGVKVHVEGASHLRRDSNYVFAANHTSYFDVLVMLPHLPVELRFLAKSDLFELPFLGWHLKRAGHLPVVFGDRAASLRSTSEAARMLREHHTSVVIFPEGERTRGQLGRFKNGAAYMAIEAKAPIVPVGIVGAAEILPPGSMHIRPGRVCLRIGQPISTEGLRPENRYRLTRLVRERIADLIGQPVEPEPVYGAAALLDSGAA
jgi:1-acyl-sn-glycerol-3-phosphate acyltransferase